MPLTSSTTRRIDLTEHLGPGADEDAIRAALAPAAQMLRDGATVAMPTETVYGLAVNALDADAVRKVFEAKGRPADNPLIIHIADAAALRQLDLEVTPAAERLMATFWPGPVTVVLRRGPGSPVPDVTTGGLDTVAVRVPGHTIAQTLIRLAGVPVAAPSANRSGRPSPTTAQHVLDDLDGRIDAVVDAGPTGVGVESTVVDCTSSPPVLLRRGGVGLERFREVVPELIVMDDASDVARSDGIDPARRSPGTRYRHYAPNARVILESPEPGAENKSEDENEHGRPSAFVGRLAGLSADRRNALLVTEETWHALAARTGGTPGTNVFVLGSRDDLEGIARNLYALLREVDAAGYAALHVESVAENGIGAAIMDRLRRAAEATAE